MNNPTQLFCIQIKLDDITKLNFLSIRYIGGIQVSQIIGNVLNNCNEKPTRSNRKTHHYRCTKEHHKIVCWLCDQSYKISTGSSPVERQPWNLATNKMKKIIHRKLFCNHYLLTSLENLKNMIRLSNRKRSNWQQLELVGAA